MERAGAAAHSAQLAHRRLQFLVGLQPVDAAVDPVGHPDVEVGAHEDVVDLRRRLALGGVGQPVRDLDRVLGVAHVVHAQPGVEVGAEHQGRAAVGARPVLVQVVRAEAQPAVVELVRRRRADADHPRVLPVGDVDDPHVVRLAGAAVGDHLVGDDEQVPALQREAGVGVAARLPVEVPDLPRLRAVGDVEHDHARVAVAEVGGVAVDQRVVRGVPLALGDVELLAAALPLTRPPPAAGLDGVARVGQVDDHPDAVAEALGDRRDVGVAAALPHDAVHAEAGGVEPADLLRVERVGQVVDGHAGAVRVAAAEHLVVDQQQAVGDLDLVGVAPVRGLPLLHQAQVGRVGRVQHARAHAAGPEVPHVDGVAGAHDLHAVAEAVQVVLGDGPQPLARAGPVSHVRSPVGR